MSLQVGPETTVSSIFAVVKPDPDFRSKEATKKLDFLESIRSHEPIGWNGEPPSKGVEPPFKKRRPEHLRKKHREYSREWRQKKKEEKEKVALVARHLSIFRVLAEEGPTMLSIHTSNPSANFMYASQAFSRHLNGIQPSSLLGVSLTQCILKEDRAMVEGKLHQIVLNNRPETFIYRFLTKSSQYLLESSARLGTQGLVLSTKVLRENPLEFNRGRPEQKEP